MNLNNNFNLLWKVCLIVFLSMNLSLLLPLHVVYAATGNTGGGGSSTNFDNNEIVKILCNAIRIMTGAAGKSIAILIIVSMAIALFLGKVSWGMAIAVAVGMGMLFGANDVVQLLSGGTGAICPPVT